MSDVVNPHRIATLLRQNFLFLAILTAAGLILWHAGWEVIGVLIALVGIFGLFGGLVSTAFVTETDGRPGNVAMLLSKDEERLVTLIRDKNIDPSTIIAKIDPRS
jgi:hypothetical protein